MSNQFRARLEPARTPENDLKATESEVPERQIISSRDFSNLHPEPEIRTLVIHFHEITEGGQRALGEMTVRVLTGSVQPLFEIPVEFLS